MAEYKLHCFAQSGNAYKVALALELAHADWEPIFVDFFKGGVRTPEFTDKNIMREVPVLEHKGKTLSQTGVILEYLTETLDEFTPQDRQEAWRWTLWDNHKLTANLATWRFLSNFLPEEKRNADVIAFLKGRAVAALNTLDAHLHKQHERGHDWIVGDTLSTADLSCIGYMYFTDEYDFDWSTVPSVVKWRDLISSLPRWKHPYDLMPGHPLAA